MEATSRADSTEKSVASPVPRLNRWLTAGLSLLAGALICFSLPPWGWWPLAPVGIAVLLYALDGAGAWRRFLIGWGVGVAWFGISTLWMWGLTPPGYVVGTLLGWGPLVGFATLACPPDRRRLLVLPAAIVAFEWFHSHAPFGGVPLSLLAMGQARGPLLSIATIGGTLLLGAAISALGVALYMAVVERRWREPVAVCVVVPLVAIGGWVWPTGTPQDEIRVAVVQGGGEQMTTFSVEQTPIVFEKHLELTRRLDPGQVDLVLWPENVVNVQGAFDDSPWKQQIAAEAQRLGATITVGVVEDAPGDPDAFLNYQLVFEPDGTAADTYEKVRRVPFGEYVPLRSLMEPIGGDALPRRDQVPGDGVAVLDTPAGPTAVAISWEIFFSRRVREGVREGGELIVNPTNGSSYWLTQVQTQQVASSSLRAAESRRWLLQAAPTGFSAVVDAKGKVLERTKVSEADVLFATVPMLRGTTPAQQFGDAPGLAVAMAAVVVAMGISQRDRRRSTAGGAGDPSDGNETQPSDI